MKWLLALAVYLGLLWSWRKIAAWLQGREDKTGPRVKRGPRGSAREEPPLFRPEDVVDVPFRDVNDEKPGEPEENRPDST